MNLAHRLAALSAVDRQTVLAGMSEADLAAMEFEWRLWARADQLPPEGEWRTWTTLAGRGAGKTRASAEFIRAEAESGRHSRIALIGPTADAIRRDMVEGGSGILAIAPPDFRPEYEPSVRRVVWPNGAIAYLLSCEEPDRARGLNVSLVWWDEISASSNQQAMWDMVQMALRIPGPLGDPPRMVISTTPKPGRLLKSILTAPTTVVTRAKTMDNVANLDTGTVQFLTDRYAGTRLGRQELDGEMLEDTDGALWNRAMMDACHVEHAPDHLQRIVVAIDPAGSSNKNSDETGIIIAGIDRNRVGYILADLSGKYSPDGWARRACDAYRGWKADRIVAEKNYGGDMVESTIKSVDPRVATKMVTATRGKMIRAEPIVAFYEQGRVKHVGNLSALEDQLCEWNPAESGPSPDRLDALVWGLTELMGGPPRMHLNPAELHAMGIRW